MCVRSAVRPARCCLNSKQQWALQLQSRTAAHPWETTHQRRLWGVLLTVTSAICAALRTSPLQSLLMHMAKYPAGVEPEGIFTFSLLSYPAKGCLSPLCASLWPGQWSGKAEGEVSPRRGGIWQLSWFTLAMKSSEHLQPPLCATFPASSREVMCTTDKNLSWVSNEAYEEQTTCELWRWW